MSRRPVGAPKQGIRRILLFLGMFLLVIVLIFVAWHYKSKWEGSIGSAGVGSVPRIESVPGAKAPSEEYVQQQTLENIRKAEEARKKGGSAVPTITRPAFVPTDELLDEQKRKAATAAGVPPSCPLDKVVTIFKADPSKCTQDNLKSARNAGVQAIELRCLGCSCPALKLSGYTAGELKSTGMSASEMRQCGFSLTELKAAGFSAADLKDAGFTAAQLKAAGFSAADLKDAGFSAADLKAAGFSAKDLKDAGFNAGQLAAGGFSAADLKGAGFSDAEIKAAGASNPACSVDALRKARAAGVSATELKNRGCGAAALKAAGYTAAELKAAGFSAKDLKNAGFSAADLKAAGFSPAELKAAGFSAKDLKDAGFSAADLKAAGFNAADLAKAGFTPEQIRAVAGIKAACDVDSLRKARAAGVSAAELKNRGCDAAALKAAGYTAAELKAAGFSAKDLKDAGFSAAELKAAGFSAADLKDAGFSAADLKNAGFSPAELKAAGFSAKDLKAAGFSPAELKAAGFTAAQLKDAGFSAAELKAAGFNAKDLKDAGFSATDLRNAGFSPAQLKAIGFTAGQLKDAGFSADDLKKAGFSAKDLRDAGFTASELKAAGFTPAQLKAVGYTSGDLVRAGFSPTQAGLPAAAEAAPGAGAPTAGLAPPPPAGGPAIPSVVGQTPEGQLAALQREQAGRMTAQQQKDTALQMQGAMAVQAQQLLSGWSSFNTQAYNAAPALTAAGGGEGGAAGEAGLKGVAGAGGAAGQPPGKNIKAGTILFAVLTTSINSDESTPVMARIVSDPFNGGVLVGQFSRVSKRVYIQFTTINIPTRDKTIAVNAVAIDPETARTALQGNVDNHYVLRYGTLFASAFVTGMGNAIQQSGSQTSQTANSTVITQPSLTLAQQAAVGIGEVGKRYGQVMSANFTTPPTVKIPGGTGMGILIMQDFVVPCPTPKSACDIVEEAHPVGATLLPPPDDP